MPRFGLFSVLLLSALLLFGLCCLPGPADASDLTQYKHLRNAYVKVTDVRERTRTEERYVPVGGQVRLENVPYKEVLVTAELRQRPPSNMDSMFGSGQVPAYLKVCMARFDAKDEKIEDQCQALRFESRVKGNVGTATFRLPEDTARYEIHMAEEKGDTGSAIKLWYPTN